ncbi:SpoIIE family protein phosphatase [Symbioplanes lichenis]|uniref:SpoIIE family protein phosphatase n=1 Tax=Symbioplanes lichenis TaxID=1629072 RepID=UPI00273933B4|nr:SpoIIE family protein phosphatase [Actinoplanes lichenis]
MDEDQPTAAELVASATEQVPFIVILCEGPDLRLAYVNAATRAMVPGRETVGRTLAEAFADVAGQQWIDMYSGVYRTGTPVTGAEWRATLTVPGGIHELYANFSITPWRDGDGTIRGVIGAGFDVTAIVQARKAAESQADRMRERYEQTRDVVVALQRELLPSGVPVLPGVQVAASYLLANSAQAAGGDWFDVVARADGTVALVVGDVVGHGVTAAGVMGQLRAVLCDRLDSGADPAEALRAADRLARRIGPAHAATVCVAVLEPGGDVRYCTAGHPPPLLLAAGGRADYLEPTGAGPLGTGPATGEFALRPARLEPGDMLLLYTDGILERPGVGLDDSRAELARVAATAAAGKALHTPGDTPAERVCGQSVELLVRATGHRDDITLLAAQRSEPIADLALTLPAELTSLRAARLALADWLARAGATDDDAFTLQHALGELLTNAVEHAFDGELGRADVHLRARLTPAGEIDAEITDHGTWREPARRSIRGRGLALTSQLVDDLTMTPGPAGTVATVRHALCRPVHTPATAAPAPPAVPAESLTVTETGPDSLAVAGAIDAADAAHLRQELLRRGRGGNLPLTVDLSAVTHLASAGVSALHHVAEQHRKQGTTLDLVAADGSPAQQVLALVALPHRAAAPLPR